MKNNFMLVYSTDDGYQTIEESTGKVVLGKNHGSTFWGWNQFQMSGFFQVCAEGTKAEMIRKHKETIRLQANHRGGNR